MILVGNKCDLEDQREVKREEGSKIAREFSCPFFETSAKNSVNVIEAIEKLIWEIARKQHNVKPKST
jgi:GTPase KRas protein